MVRDSHNRVSLTPGNWIGLLILCALVVVPLWRWTNEMSASVKGLEKANAGQDRRIELIERFFGVKEIERGSKP